jgi:hypothetical protein
MLSSNTDLGSLMGYGTLNDASTIVAGSGSQKVLAITGPFQHTDGSVTLCTHGAHHCSTGNTVRIAGTETFIDGVVHTVTQIIDESRLVIVPDICGFIAAFPQRYVVRNLYVEGYEGDNVVFDFVKEGTAAELLSIVG